VPGVTMLLQAARILYTRAARELMEDIFRFAAVPRRPVRAFCIRRPTPSMHPPYEPDDHDACNEER